MSWRIHATVVLAVALLFSSVARPEAIKRFEPPKSAFADFRTLGDSEFELGLGNIFKLDCVIDLFTQPAIYSGNMLVDCDGEVPHNETTIAVNPRDPNHAVGGYHSYQLIRTGQTTHVAIVGATSVTFDGGATWREVIPPQAPYQFSGDPALAFDAAGRLYFANIADHEGDGGLNFTLPSVIVTTSDDGGLTWSSPVTVAAGKNTAASPGGPWVFQDKEFITADASLTSPFVNRAYVTWTSFQGAFAFVRAPIVMSRSDGGQAWTAGAEISGFSPHCSAALFGQPNECDLNQFSVPTVAPGGRIYVGFENFNTPAENQYLVVASTDGGATWNAPSRVDQIADINYPANVDGRNTLTGCQFRVASPGNIAADPSDPAGMTVYATWADNRNGTAKATNSDVFLARSSDGGLTWRTTLLDRTRNDQFYPWVAVAPDGRVDVGYMDRSYSTGQSVCQYGFTLTRAVFDRRSGRMISAIRQRVDTGLSDLKRSRWFAVGSEGNSRFIGDYNAVAVDRGGRTWSLWTDQRADVAAPPSPNRVKGQHAVGTVTP